MEPVDKAIQVLNEALEQDSNAIHALIRHRVVCNAALADHRSIQVGQYTDSKLFHVGLLGIINGIFGITPTGRGLIEMVVDDDGTILRFQRHKD